MLSSLQTPLLWAPSQSFPVLPERQRQEKAAATLADLKEVGFRVWVFREAACKD